MFGGVYQMAACDHVAPNERHHLMVRKILAALAGVALLCGAGFGAASLASAATSSSGLCAANGTRVVTYFPGACPAKSFPISGPVTVVAPAPASPVKIVHKLVTINADFPQLTDVPAPTLAQKTVTVDGLPAFTGTLETWASNSGDNVAAGTTVSVIAPGQPGGNVATALGSTSRKFVVNTTGFTGGKSFSLDIWVLVVTP